MFPRLLGQASDFEAHGKLWRVKRTSKNTWLLWDLDQLPIPRVRFGNRAEIGKDIEVVKLTGKLPGKVDHE